MRLLGIGAAIGAAVAYFLDPQSGKRRRHGLVDRTFGLFRRGGRTTARVGRGVAAETYGVVQKATHLREQPKDFDDATLARKVETEIFRDADAPKGTVDVNVQNGVVQLRGEVQRPELIDGLVAKTRKVQGVTDVENLLHTPGMPAPMHQ